MSDNTDDTNYLNPNVPLKPPVISDQSNDVNLETLAREFNLMKEYKLRNPISRYKIVNTLALFQMASQGLTIEQCGNCMWIPASMFILLVRQNPELQEIFDSGVDWGIQLVTHALQRKALNGDTVCMLFYLKARARWRENDPVRPGEGQTVVFQTFVGANGQIQGTPIPDPLTGIPEPLSITPGDESQVSDNTEE